ncbi:hypothetical protein AB4Y78_15360 [Janibacter sp. RAF52]
MPWQIVLCPSPNDHFTFDTFAVAVIEYGPAVAYAESEGRAPLPSPTHSHTGTPTVPVHASALPAVTHGDAPIWGPPNCSWPIALSRTSATVTVGADSSAVSAGTAPAPP